MAAFERKTTLVRSRRVLASPFVALGGVTLGTVAAVVTKGTGIPPMLPFLFLHFAGLLGSVLVHLRWWRERRGDLKVDTSGVWLDGRCLVERRALVRADVMQTKDGTFVRLIRRGPLNRDLDIAVASEEEGKELVQALRLDAGSSVAEFVLLAGTARQRLVKSLSFLGVYLLGMGLDLGYLFTARGSIPELASHAWVFLGVFMALTLGLTTGFGYLMGDDTLNVSVGADGVRLRSRRKTTFHPFATIAGASTNGKEVVLRFVDGTERTIHNPGGGEKLRSINDRSHDAHQLVARIQSHLENHSPEAPPDASALARNGRSAEEWIRDASALRESKATFRTNVIPTEQLWRIIEDPTADVSARAGAALALRHDLDEPARVRLRIAADACAAPNLRVALETVAESDLRDEDALREAFASVTDAPLRAMSLRS